MSVYNKAHDLARELTASVEYQDYLKAKENLEKDKPNMMLLEEFRRKQWEVQMAQFLGQEIEEEVINQLDQVYQALSLNPLINEFLMAEYRLTRLLGDVQKILSTSLDTWFTIKVTGPLVN